MVRPDEEVGAWAGVVSSSPPCPALPGLLPPALLSLFFRWFFLGLCSDCLGLSACFWLLRFWFLLFWF